MIIFLHGPDDYRRIQKKRWFLAEFEKKYSAAAIGYFDMEADGAPAKLAEFAANQSIFETAKLAVVENAFELEADKLAKLLKPLVDLKGTTILISVREKPVKALAFLLEKPVITHLFEALAGSEMVAFLAEQAKRFGITLAPATAQFLATIYAGNSWAAVTELEKLSALKRSIEKKDLDVLDLEAAPNYWALLNGMKSFDGRARLFALEKLLALGDAPAKLFNILAAQAGEKAPRMASYDLSIKSGRVDYEEALLDLVLDA